MIRFVTACSKSYDAQNQALRSSLRQHMTGEWHFHWEHLLCEENWTPEMFWAMASDITDAACREYPNDTIVYLDSDCWALGDLRPAIEEVAAAGADVGMLTHRFPAHRQATHGDRGGWWVGFNVFRPTPRARACAAWWASMAQSRCVRHDPGDEYLGIPAGLAGDQPYLHAFERIAKVHEIQRRGFVASWNADAPGWKRLDSSGFPYETQDGLKHTRAWLWHGHEYRFDAAGECVQETGYPVADIVARNVVDPWKAAVKAAAEELAA